MLMSGMGYICSAGESFDSVALSVYGDEAYASELLSANPAMSDKMIFEGGEVLLLPVIAAYETDSGLQTIKETAPWKVV